MLAREDDAMELGLKFEEPSVAGKLSTEEAVTLARKLRQDGLKYKAIAAELFKAGFKNEDNQAVSVSYVGLLIKYGGQSRGGASGKKLASPSYVKVEEKVAAPPPAAEVKPAADAIMVIIARPGQLRDIAGDLFK